MKEIHYNDFTIYDNGKVINDNNLELGNGKSGYIYIEYKGKHRIVEKQRFIYWVFHQDEFDLNDRYKVVLFKDNNKKNFKLDNLYLDDIREMSRGEKHVNCKLSNEDVREIRRIRKLTGSSYRDIGKMFGVSGTHIMKIIKRTARKEVE